MESIHAQTMATFIYQMEEMRNSQISMAFSRLVFLLVRLGRRMSWGFQSIRKILNKIEENVSVSGLTGLKWNAANKSVYTTVPDIIEAFEEHLTFICRKARFTILQLVWFYLYLLNNFLFEVSIRPAIVNLTKNVFKKCNSGAINLKLVLNRPLDVDHINLIRDTSEYKLQV